MNRAAAVERLRGSVRDRASQHNRDVVGNLSSGRKNRKHGEGPAKLTKTVAIGGDMLAVKGTDTEEVASASWPRQNRPAFAAANGR
jgi:hypothetical protein